MNTAGMPDCMRVGLKSSWQSLLPRMCSSQVVGLVRLVTLQELHQAHAMLTSSDLLRVLVRVLDSNGQSMRTTERLEEDSKPVSR